MAIPAAKRPPARRPSITPIRTILLGLLLAGSASSFRPRLVNKTSVGEYQTHLTSQDKRYQARITYSPGTGEFVPIDRFELTDSTGRTIYAKSNYGHTVFDIANSGVVVGIDFDGPISGRAVLHFYDTTGVELGSARIGFLRATAFSGDGTRYCVLDGIAGLRVFAPDGTELHTLRTGNYFAVSADGERIALAGDSTLRLYQSGVETGQIHLSSPFLRDIKFSRDGSHLLILERKTLSLYRFGGSRVFSYVEADPKLNFTSADISPESPLVVAGLDQDPGRGIPGRHTQGLIYLFSTNGTLLWKQGIGYSDWNYRVPDVSFSQDRCFVVRTGREHYEFRY